MEQLALVSKKSAMRLQLYFTAGRDKHMSSFVSSTELDQTISKALNGLPPAYLSDLLHPVCPSGTLWLSDYLSLSIPDSCLRCKGDRALPVAGPKLRNCFPLHVRSALAIECLKSRLKTHLFSLAF